MRLCAFLLTLAIPALAGDFRFAIVGDRTGSHAPGVFEAVWKAVAEAKPALVITVGDWIEGGNDATAEAEWKELEPVYKSTGLATYFVAGNHDIWNRASRLLFEKYTGRPATYSFDYQGAHFTVLDNAQSLQLPEDQLAFLEKDLAAHPQAKPKFVFFHQPGWVVPLLMGSKTFALHEIAKRHGVTAVISGHTHGWLRRELEGVIYFTAASAGGQLRNGKGFEDGFFYGYALVDVKDENVKIVTQELGPPHGQGRRKE